MVKKAFIYGAGGLVVAITVLVVANVLGGRVGVAEIVVQKDVVLDEATLQEALAHSADCAGFKITEVRPAGEGKVLARITGMRGACCLSPAKAALAKVPGVQQVEVALLRKSGA